MSSRRPRYYVVNSGRSRATHLSTQRPHGFVGDFLGSGVFTLCGLPATRDVAGVFRPDEVSCRECRRRRELAQAPKRAKGSFEEHMARAQELMEQLRRSLQEKEQRRQEQQQGQPGEPGGVGDEDGEVTS